MSPSSWCPSLGASPRPPKVSLSRRQSVARDASTRRRGGAAPSWAGGTPPPLTSTTSYESTGWGTPAAPRPLGAAGVTEQALCPSPWRPRSRRQPPQHSQRGLRRQPRGCSLRTTNLAGSAASGPAPGPCVSSTDAARGLQAPRYPTPTSPREGDREPAGVPRAPDPAGAGASPWRCRRRPREGSRFPFLRWQPSQKHLIA
jgi:hypothetical protein